MSLKDRQIEKAVEKALQEELLAGRFPDTYMIDEKVNRAFYEQPVGRPRYVFQPVQEDERSNPHLFNQTMNDIHEDISTAFEEAGNQQDQLMSMANAYETEKRLLTLSLRQLDKRLEALSDKIAHPTSRQIIHDSFDTFTNVDFVGNEEKHILKTDAFVDLKSNQVTLQTVHRGSTRYPIADALFKVQMITHKEDKSISSVTENRPFQHALQDTVNQAWQYVVVKDILEKTQVQADIELKETVVANAISIRLHTPKEMDVELSISEEGTTWKQLKTYTTSTQAEWMFDSPVKYIRFLFTKQEPDQVNGVQMEYFFGAFGISVRKEVFTPQSYLVSKPYVIDNETIDAITFQAQEVIFPQTNIQYYAGMEDDAPFIEWQEIRPNQRLHLNQVAKESLAITSASDGYGTWIKENFSIPYHSLVVLPERPLTRRTNLYMGDYMWKMETRLMQGLADEYLPTLSDWHDIKGVDTKFVPVEETMGTKQYELTPNSLQRFTVHAYLPIEEEVFNTDFLIGTAEIQVYLNNNLIKPIIIDELGSKRYKYTYRFQAGWNKLEILTYCKEGAQPFKPGLYLKDIATKIFAVTEPLIEMNTYDLYHNVSKKDIQYFAIEDQTVVVNYNPAALDVLGVGVRYAMEYDYLPVDAKKTSQLRFMAVLSRESASERVTPILKGYKMILE